MPRAEARRYGVILQQVFDSVNLRAARRSPWVAALGVLLIVWGQWQWFEHLESVRPGALWVLPGIGLLLVAARAPGVLLVRQPLLRPLARPACVLSWKLPVALAGVGVCVYTGWRALAEQNTVWDLYIMWGAGIWLTMVGLVPGWAARRWRRRVARSLQAEWRTWLLVGGLLLVALVLRLAWLATSPYIQAGDEAAFSIQAVDIKDKFHWQVNPFKYGVWHHPWVFHTMLGMAIEVFGQTTTASRFPSAILGALTTPAVYLMGRRMFDRRVGLVAAVFMAAYPLHVHFSRTGINQVGDPLFTALAFAFLTRALRDGDPMEAALAGLALGFSQYFYSAARIVPLLMVCYVGLYALIDWRAIWRRLGVLFVTGVVASVVVFPNLYSVYMDKERPISPRLDQVSIWKTGNVEAAADAGRLKEYWIDQLQRPFMAYVQIPDESGFYGAYNPVLGWYGGVPFLVGVAYTLRGWRDPRRAVLLAWVVATAVLGGVLLVDPPHFPRYISVAPGLAVLVALGLTWIGQIAVRLALALWVQAGRRRAGWLRRASWAVPVGLVIVLGLADLRTYVFDYLPQKLIYGEPTVRLNEVVDIVRSFDERYRVRYFSSLELDMSGTDIGRYLLGDRQGTEFSAEIERWREVLEPGAYAFVIAPERFNDVGGKLLFQMPGGELREYINPRTGEPLVFVYFVTVV